MPSRPAPVPRREPLVPLAAFLLLPLLLAAGVVRLAPHGAASHAVPAHVR